MNRYLPKSVVALRDYSYRKFLSDLIAGLTVGLVALPLAMAFAISSGVPPQAGIYTAIVAGFLISALGGSKTQIGGPTGAFVVIVYGIVAKYGIDGLCVCTLMAGVILVLLGVTGLGATVKYIPRPVIVGFTNGIAVLIASTQIKDFFGLSIDKMPGEFLGRMEALACHRLGFRRDVGDRIVSQIREAHSGVHCGAGAGHAARRRHRAVGGNHRHAFRRNSDRAARVRRAAF
jgi:SulP family sulfate permease